jgi:predicted ATPase/DNA-binding NarL/FixJ family response regulator
MCLDLSPRGAVGESPGNLPLQLTSFIGREREVEEVRRLLGGTRLLTLTGAGGCGKTRLALCVAAAIRSGPACRDGVWLVELAALADPVLVAQTVAAALGTREVPGRSAMESLVDSLQGRSLLIVLDNCEHLVEPVARVVEALLRSCPDLRVLATSREALGCAGERTWRVPSLAVPPESGSDDRSAERLGRYEAVRLFAERARSVQPGFMVTDENVRVVAEICRRLDGIPLAIELAAARVRVFSVQQIAERLDDRFRLLSGGQRTALPRHRTLRALVDWSHDLLSEPERVVLRRLSVFAGGWRFEAAEAVAAGDGIRSYAVLDLLAQLVDKSLVNAEEERGAARYRMLETIRQYAEERLREAGETERVRHRHLAHFLALAEEAESGLRRPEAPAVLGALEAEHDNLRAALEWGLACGGDAALRLSGALARFWWLHSYHDEGLRWLGRALAGRSERTAARMKALHGAAYLVHHRRDAATARAMLGESLAIARDLGDRWTEAWVLYVLGRVAYYDNEPATAAALGRESLALAERVGDDWLISWPLHLLGLAAHIAADDPTARAYYARSLAIRRALGDQEGIVVLLGLLGIVALREADVLEARALFREALTIQQDLGGPWHLSMNLAMFASLAATVGQPVRAVRLAAASAALSETHGTPRIRLIEALLEEKLEAVRQSLDEAVYAAAWAEGRAMSVEESVVEALAIEVTTRDTPPARAPAPSETGLFGALSPTELQVLKRLASGCTTKEIAAELVVAVSTVDRHITHIYEKLGVRNRAAATAFALKHGLV